MQSKHGSYNIQLIGNVVKFDGKGPWDEVAVIRYRRDMQATIQSLNGINWAFMGYFHGAAVLPPQAEEDLSAVVAWRIENGMRACSIVLSDTSCPAIVRSQFERIYTKAGIKHRFFYEEEEAYEWLSQLGFSQ